ncbi:MAG: glycosyl hydrolase family 28 protein [Thermogutta sp.]|jgi:hypothetical protein
MVLQHHFTWQVLFRLTTATAFACFASSGAMTQEKDTYLVTEFGATADDDVLDTQAFQKAIDVAARHGGTVRVPKGRFITGRLQLPSGVRLFLEEGAVLQGSADFRDYGQGRWTDSFLFAENAERITIEGPGTIDGADCEIPGGEEGFRGPHAIRFVRCRNVTIRDVTITRAGNYAVLCNDSEDFLISGVKFRGGHDGVHAQACRRFRVVDCDFRTGDDCLAGCDNVDFEVARCQINSSCNGFRLGCVHLRVHDCRFWGPGEYPHRITIKKGKPRTNMLSAFVHFAPTDRNPKLPSDDWLIQNCTMDTVDAVYLYDFEKGVWQTGQPAKRLAFENIRAQNIALPLRVLGDKDRQFDLTLKNVSIALRDDRADQPVLDITQFGRLTLENGVLQNSGKQPVLRARDGREIHLHHVEAKPTNPQPFLWTNVEKVSQD